jgi:hypothetical protein
VKNLLFSFNIINNINTDTIIMGYLKKLCLYIALKLLILWAIINIPFEHQLSNFMNNKCSDCFGKNIKFTFLMDKNRDIYLSNFKYTKDDVIISWDYGYFSYNLLSLLKLSFTKISIKNMTINYHKEKSTISNMTHLGFKNLTIDSLLLNKKSYFKKLEFNDDMFSGYLKDENSKFFKIKGHYKLHFDTIKLNLEKNKLI